MDTSSPQYFPDGGVARFRAYGVVVPDWKRVKMNTLVDLAAIENGGMVVAASDMFFGSKEKPHHAGSGKKYGRRLGNKTPPRPRL